MIPLVCGILKKRHANELINKTETYSHFNLTSQTTWITEATIDCLRSELSR